MHRCFCCCLFCIGICLCLYLGICLCLYIYNCFTLASAAHQFPQQHWQVLQLTCSGSRSTRTWSPPPEGHSAQLSILRGRAICSDWHLAALALLFQPVHNALGWIPATKVNLRQTRSIFIFNSINYDDRSKSLCDNIKNLVLSNMEHCWAESFQPVTVHSLQSKILIAFPNGYVEK